MTSRDLMDEIEHLQRVNIDLWKHIKPDWTNDFDETMTHLSIMRDHLREVFKGMIDLV